jgi:2-C-methyl-D-erythritol 2,4-cyclodiphosphate synthase
MRVGQGIDAHPLRDSGRIVLGGVVVEERRGVDATSDGDVVAHAICDALLGAAALGDMGEMFPSADPDSQDADSMEMLAAVVARLAAAGLAAAQLDVTVIAETIRVAPHRDSIRRSLASALGIDVAGVSVKATTTDGLGFIGRDEGIACVAVVVVE